MEKPINLKALDLENGVVKLLNDSKLPAFIIKPILERIMNQVLNLEKMQLENAQKEYEESLKKKGDSKNGTK